MADAAERDGQGLAGAQGKAGDPDQETEAGGATGPDMDETGLMPETPAEVARELIDGD